jgi:hypothetical protein
MLAALLLPLVFACRPIHTLHRQVAGPDLVPDPRSPYLKAHLLDGGVRVFETWAVDEERRRDANGAFWTGPAAGPAALAALREERLLATEPSDTYHLHYQVPADLAGAAAFLDTRGWYLEWRREEWLREEDPRALGCTASRSPKGYRADAGARPERWPASCSRWMRTLFTCW